MPPGSPWLRRQPAALRQGCTVIYIGGGRRPGGLSGPVGHPARPDAAQMIRGCPGRRRARRCCSPATTRTPPGHIAGQLGIQPSRRSCLPEDKLAWIDRSQQTGKLVCMVGDGINDAPALKKAHVGIAMGGVGSDIAVDAADIALVNDDIRELPHLLALSRRMMRHHQGAI